ncbi:MAG TPA: 2-C-methyl-D-erythritol 4-phosphate cytidylyltransferase [Gemmatimonadales bacterium]|nr:2-C-methyl-D-erythritol 4-phosphate cytidylyltransferase [Gemmatimonadales bacterium]
MPRDVGVIIVAAGEGRRVGGDVPKQYRIIAGVPLLLRAIRPFRSHPEVRHIIVVVPGADLEAPPGWLVEATGDRLQLVAGGATRRASVAAGLAALPAECTVVLVHDGARPFPPPDVIDGGMAVARNGHSAVPAVPLADTLKRADACGLVLGTVPRAGLWRIQTPQAFPRDVLERAHAQIQLEGLEATDDAMLVELDGGRVELLPSTVRNLKVTTPEDLVFATWLATAP